MKNKYKKIQQYRTMYMQFVLKRAKVRTNCRQGNATFIIHNHGGRRFPWYNHEGILYGITLNDARKWPQLPDGGGAIKPRKDRLGLFVVKHTLSIKSFYSLVQSPIKGNNNREWGHLTQWADVLTRCTLNEFSIRYDRAKCSYYT